MKKNNVDAHYIYWCHYGVSIKKSSFTLIRVMQTGMIAAVILLVISTFTNDGACYAGLSNLLINLQPNPPLSTFPPG
jgi:hypothetical protein